MSAKILEALRHVKKVHPDVKYVIYTLDQQWIYVDSELNAPTFDRDAIDVSLLEDALDEVPSFPAIFCEESLT